MVTNFTGRRDVDCSSSSLTFDYGFSMNSAANESWRDDPDRPSRNSGILEEDWEKRRIQSMLNAGTLTFKEFAMREPLPLATIHDAVLQFLRGRDDAVVFGAQAVNAYVDEPRMSQDIDLVSTRATELAEELREYLSERFHIAVRVPVIGAGKGYRLFQIQKARNRHLVDVRKTHSLPQTERIEDVLVMSPPELIAHKVISYHKH